MVRKRGYFPKIGEIPNLENNLLYATLSDRILSFSLESRLGVIDYLTKFYDEYQGAGPRIKDF